MKETITSVNTNIKIKAKSVLNSFLYIILLFLISIKKQKMLQALKI